MVQRVCVIGGGSSGLTSIKSCLEEGLEPTCFESSDDIGGLWRFKENPEADRASIYSSVIINTSKEMMCFSDFPIPANFPNYMHNSLIMDYFRMYAEHFKLTKHIRLRTKVLQVNPRSDFKQSGQWDVDIENEKGETERHIFDAVMICIGHHCHPNLPLHDFPDRLSDSIDTFDGQYFHSRDYKTAEAWWGKRVVVVGIGNSGADIAVELSRVSKQVFLSTRRGAWIMNRVGEHGTPMDLDFSRRMTKKALSLLPFNLMCRLGENQLNRRFDHSLYSLKPKHRLFSQHPTLSDELPNRILSGTVRIKPNIRRLQGSSVEFDEGTVEDNIDLVVFATGYNFSFPFLPPQVLAVSKNKANLYKYMFPPGLERPTLAVIGLVQPLGAIMPVSEIQARWATRVFKGLNKLPPKDNMLKDIKQKEDLLAKRYVTTQRHTIQVNFNEYMDEIADQLGVRPSLLWLLVTEPSLGLEVLLGPCTPYQYRLTGPGQWGGARQAIMTQWDRVAQPLRTRPLEISESKQRYLTLALTLGAATMALGCYQVMQNHPSLLNDLDPSPLLDKIKPYLPLRW